MLSFLYGPTLTYLHDYQKNHNFDYMDFCQQSDVSAFCCLGCCQSFPSKEQVSLNFMAAITVHIDFGAQEKATISIFSPSIYHEVMGPGA